MTIKEFKTEIAKMIGCTPMMVHAERKRKYGDHGHWIVKVWALEYDLLKYEIEDYNSNAGKCYDEAFLKLKEIEDELPQNISYKKWKKAKDLNDKIRR